jgi:cytochrome c peroxidase
MVVWSPFSRTLTLLGRDPGVEAAVVQVTTASALTDEIRQGRALFHAAFDKRISSNRRACASCHPEGREDGLVWSSPEGPRNTPMLAGQLADTAPYGWDGAHATLESQIAHVLKRLGGTGLEAPDLAALVAYTRALKPPPRPAIGESERASIQRGEALFASPETTCRTCHLSPVSHTDNAPHDVKSAPFAGMTFDTPSLRFVGRSEPYFHDGRYKTLREVIQACDGKMGRTRHLDAQGKTDLEAYMKSL